MVNRISFEVQIKGNGASPSTIGAGDLGAILQHLQKAIDHVLDEKLGLNRETIHGPTLSLIAVKEGNSSDLEFLSPASVIPYYGLVTEAIATHNFDDVPKASQSELAAMSRLLVKRRWEAEFTEYPEYGISGAVISSEARIESPESPRTMGETTLYGYLLQSGGVRPKIKIRLVDGEMIFLKVSDSIAIELGKRLYSEVGVEGLATWRLEDWKVIDFEVTKITDYDPEGLPLRQAFEELGNASGNRWAGIDAVEFVQELRGEDDTR